MLTKPEPKVLLSLHQRLVDGDPIAPAELATVVLAPLAEVLRLGGLAPRDADMAEEAATDAVLEFAKAPQVYVPARSSVWSFLELAARRNLSNLIQKEQRQYGKILRYRDVALHDSSRKKVEGSPLAFLAKREASASMSQRLDAEVGSLTPIEAAFFRLMSDGIRATSEYARALGISDKPQVEQQRAVKQVKDRLLKRLKRSLRETDDA